MPERRNFPLPWRVEQRPACFIVKDADGQSLAFVYFEDEAGRRAETKLLKKDDARRLADNIAKPPHLLERI